MPTLDRWAAVTELADVADPDAVALLEGLCADRDPMVKAAAERALTRVVELDAKHGEISSMGLLARQFLCTHSAGRRGKALSLLREERGDHLYDLLANSSPAVRAAAAEHHGRLVERSATGALSRLLLEDDEPEVRRSCAYTLAVRSGRALSIGSRGGTS